jgi:hypothetical protein
MSVKCSYSEKLHRSARLLLALLAPPCLILAGTASAGIAPASASAMASGSRAQASVTAETARVLRGEAMMSPSGGWAVSLTASPTALLPGQSATLTAGASYSLGIPPAGTWYLHIVDVSESPSVGVAVCGIPSCQKSVSEPVSTEQEYAAYVSNTPGQSTSGILTAGSPSVIVDWRYFIPSPFPPRLP